ncbi:MAG: hypothetical protein IJF83_13715 [Methanobrevibacter sp.]|nr:hypothetical protein [Methanobrevibacter sp.]
MTIIRNFDEKCSVCGKSSPQPVLTSTNSFGYPDLDFRPPEMQRSTMNTWIHECPHCGYVAGNLEEDADFPDDFLKSDEYLSCEGNDFKSDLSKLFYRSYLISRHKGDVMMCFLSLRNCAWKCDDYEDENALSIRRLALPYLDELIKTADEDKNSLLLIKAYFLRRIGEFEKLLREYEGLTIDDEVMNSVILFQLERAREGDTECYTVEDVVEK